MSHSQLQKPVSTYVAILTGDQVVPPVNTTAHGEADFAIHHHKKKKDDYATYNITLFEVDHLKEVDLRQAQDGKEGDLVIALWGPADNGLSQVSLFSCSALFGSRPRLKLCAEGFDKRKNAG